MSSGYSVFARYYDALTGNVDYPARASYFDALVQLHAPEIRQGRAPLLLDLACGTGSLSVALAKLGYEVIGADSSEEMLSVAMEKSAEAGESILFLRQSMQNLDLYGTVEVTVCALDSLNHLPGERALSSVLSRVSLFTAPGGLFLFDVNTPYKHREILSGNTFVYEPKGLYCVWQNQYHPKDGRVDITLDFFEEQANGTYRRLEERFTERLFSHEVLSGALDAAGFDMLAVYGDDGYDPPEETTQRAVYVTRRRADTNPISH